MSPPSPMKPRREPRKMKLARGRKATPDPTGAIPLRCFLATAIIFTYESGGVIERDLRRMIGSRFPDAKITVQEIPQ